MSKIVAGVFLAVFIGALAYELLNRTKPELTEQFEKKLSEGLDSILRTVEGKA
jgi:hypothetical protein